MLEFLFTRMDQLGVEVLGEVLETFLVHVEEREDLEEPLDGGKVLVLDCLVKPPTDDSSDLVLCLMEGGDAGVQAHCGVGAVRTEVTTG